jgi:exopolysaccharide biosynthesis polyprenyl glycosylphosphotransferase
VAIGPGQQGLDNRDAGGRPTGAPAADRLQAVRARDQSAPAPSGAIVPAPGAGDALQRYRSIAIGLALTDAACILAALMASYQLRYSTRPMPLAELAVVVTAPLLWVGVFRASNLYAPQHLAPPEQFRRVIGATSLGFVLVVMASYWSKSSFPRSWVGLGWLLVLLFELMTRGSWAWYQERLKRAGRLAFRTLIIGTTAEATRLAEILKAPASGFTPLGYVRASVQAVPMNSLPLVGDVADLRQLVREHAADCLFVASSSVSDQDMAWIGQVARREGSEVRISANLTQTLTSRLTLQKVGGAIALSFRPVRLTGAQLAMKRAFDLAVASVALLVSLPLWAGIAAAVRLTSRGPVLFHQERVSKDGRVFRMHKFRTMRTNVDSFVNTTTPFFKLESDPRLTRVGRLIRRLSLDELPQFWNVLRGEMSIVGPRPLPADQVAANLELLGPRHEVPAGVTGWWQINGRSKVTPEEALQLDLFYIENWSLTLDLYILFRTFGAVVGQKGAY